MSSPAALGWLRFLDHLFNRSQGRIQIRTPFTELEPFEFLQKFLLIHGRLADYLYCSVRHQDQRISVPRLSLANDLLGTLPSHIESLLLGLLVSHRIGPIDHEDVMRAAFKHQRRGDTAHERSGQGQHDQQQQERAD